MGPLFEYAKKHITFKTVAESEDIVLVLRAHLLIESFLDLILCHGLFQGNQDLYDNLDFNFSKKQNLAKRILHNELIEAISAINKIRTKFAHDLEAKLEAIDLIVLDKIYSKKMETIKW